MSSPRTSGPIPMLSRDIVESVSVPAASLSIMTGAVPAGDTVVDDLLQRDQGEQHLRSVLDEWGFAIITDILSTSEIQDLEKLWASEIQALVHRQPEEEEEEEEEDKKVPIVAEDEVVDQRRGRREWQEKFIADPLQFWPPGLPGRDFSGFALGNHRMACEYGLVQSQFSWTIRRHPKVLAAYQAMYPGKDLCVGTDNVFFNTETVVGKEEDNWWPHCDLNAYNEPSGQWSVYQGIVYLWSSEASDRSTTVIYPKSHKEVYDKFMRNNKERFIGADNHFCMHPAEEFETLAKNHLRRVPMPAGSMLLFSSRTTHQGWSHGPRLAQTVCWEPKERRDETALRRKKEAVFCGIPTTHWASLGITHPSANHPTSGGDPTTGITLQKTAHLWCRVDAGDSATSEEEESKGEKRTTRNTRQDILQCL